MMRRPNKLNKWMDFSKTRISLRRSIWSYSKVQSLRSVFIRDRKFQLKKLASISLIYCNVGCGKNIFPDFVNIDYRNINQNVVLLFEWYRINHSASTDKTAPAYIDLLNPKWMFFYLCLPENYPSWPGACTTGSLLKEYYNVYEPYFPELEAIMLWLPIQPNCMMTDDMIDATHYWLRNLGLLETETILPILLVLGFISIGTAYYLYRKKH